MVIKTATGINMGIKNYARGGGQEKPKCILTPAVREWEVFIQVMPCIPSPSYIHHKEYR